jgi:hypothetical protein
MQQKMQGTVFLLVPGEVSKHDDGNRLTLIGESVQHRTQLSTFVWPMLNLVNKPVGYLNEH